MRRSSLRAVLPDIEADSNILHEHLATLEQRHHTAVVGQQADQPRMGDHDTCARVVAPFIEVVRGAACQYIT